MPVLYISMASGPLYNYHNGNIYYMCSVMRGLTQDQPQLSRSFLKHSICLCKSTKKASSLGRETPNSPLAITSRRLIPTAMTDKPALKDPNQIIQPLDAEVGVLVVLQMAVPVIQE